MSVWGVWEFGENTRTMKFVYEKKSFVEVQHVCGGCIIFDVLIAYVGRIVKQTCMVFNDR